MIDVGTDRIVVQLRDAVGELIFNNPSRRNAISFAMWKAIAVGLDALDADPAVRVVVLRGAGGESFVSGADISEFEELRRDSATAKTYNEASANAWRALSGFSKPLIAAIDGYCIGGGLGVAMKADLRIATEAAQFGVPAARLGIAYPVDSLKDLVSLVGPAAAKMIMFTGRTFDAGEALRLGVVNQVVAKGDLDPTIEALTAALVENAPLTISASKETINAIAAGRSDPERLDVLARACLDSADYAEGRRAFMEKRRPVFSGR
jgi:enoyl-CoA hydratase